jgi:type II secretory pathway pseudopilin PulG
MSVKALLKPAIARKSLGFGTAVAITGLGRITQAEAKKMKKNLKRLFRNRKGITLLEVMMAMLILAFGVLGLAPMIVVSMFSNSYSNQVTVADAIALDWLEEIKSWYRITPLPYSQTACGVQGIFTRQTQVGDATTDAAIPAGVYKIQVTVSWTDQEQVPRSVTYFSYKAKEY